MMLRSAVESLEHLSSPHAVCSWGEPRAMLESLRLPDREAVLLCHIWQAHKGDDARAMQRIVLSDVH